MTDNHDFNTPEEGATDWHEPLNENFEDLDAAIEIRDRAANLDDYDAELGTKFLATDTGAVYVGTEREEDEGAAWVELESVGQTREPTPVGDWIYYAEHADEIQPAIDALAEPNDDGTQGGIVKLGPGVYEPETTIWLKAGVTLEGTSRLGDPRVDGVGSPQGTVLTTASMGSDPTFRHDGDHPHPHFPVVANYRAPPLEMGDRDPTDEERRYWGDNVGLRHLTIDAGPKQRWSEDDTYFGVYDGCIFSRSDHVVVENVTTRNVLGYGGFFNGCRKLRDIGSVWQGGATDYHGSALTIHTTYPPERTIYTDESVWDVDVIGPPPTVEVFSHGIRFVSGGWSNAKITATERVFLGDEEAYWDGEAPIVDPGDGNVIFNYEHGRIYVEDYHIEAGDAYDRELTGFSNDYQYAMLNNVSTSNTDVAYDGDSRRPNEITDCHFDNTHIGVDSGANIPAVNGLVISNADKGFRLGYSHSNTQGTVDRLSFRNVDVGLFGQDNNKPIYFNHPDFSGCEEPFEQDDYDSPVIQDATGL